MNYLDLLLSSGKTLPNNWNQNLENRFQDEYSNISNKFRLSPNPDDPQHFYNWRDFALNQWRQNRPMMSGENQHFPSTFKTPEHPRRFLEGMDTATGIPLYEQLPQDREDLSREQLGRMFRQLFPELFME